MAQELSELPKKGQSVICSFEYAAENFSKLREFGFDSIVVDEAHYLKEPKAKRSIAVLGPKGIVRGEKISRVWLLSGTPAPNHAGELWLMLYTFGMTKLKYREFLNTFCLTRPTSYGIKVSGTNRQKIPELQELLKPIMIRRLKKDVMKELPPIIYDHIFVEPGPVKTELLPSFVQYHFPVDRREELFEEIDRQEKLLGDVIHNMKHPKGGADTAAIIQGMFDSVSTLRRYNGLQKVAPAVELVKKWFKFNPSQFEKIVIFCIHADVIEQLRIGLKELNPVVLYGKTPPHKRQKRIDKFQNNPKCKVFIGNIRAAGVAITLTSSHNVLFVEQDWVPGNNAQAVMRCHRIGQQNTVFVKFLALDDSLDAHVMKILKAKTRDLTAIFDDA